MFVKFVVIVIIVLLKFQALS